MSSNEERLHGPCPAARESGETFSVPPEPEAELIESIADAERGETITAEELLRRLRRNIW